jgi:hypothetical protein
MSIIESMNFEDPKANSSESPVLPKERLKVLVIVIGD